MREEAEEKREPAFFKRAVHPKSFIYFPIDLTILSLIESSLPVQQLELVIDIRDFR